MKPGQQRPEISLPGSIFKSVARKKHNDYPKIVR